MANLVEEIEEVSGYLFTHADCPNCTDDNAFEGDCSGETVKCKYCDYEFYIGTVR